MNAFRHFVAPTLALCMGVGAIGCSSDPEPQQVPPNARLLVQGDQMLSYTATQKGTVYVYDSSDETLLYSGEVDKGQAISIDPEEDQIMIDNRLAVEKDIHAGNRHRIYFVPDRDAPDRVIEERTTIRERDADMRDADTTIRREEKRTVETRDDGDVTVKKETTIKSD